MSRTLFFFGILIAPIAAFAAAPGVDPCWTLGGGFCDSVAGESVIDDGLSQTGLLFAGLGGAAAVLFAIIGGAQLLLSFGDESKITKGRNSLIFSLAGFALVLASQSIVSFVVASAQSSGLESSADNPLIALMATISQIIITALNIIFVIVMVVAGIRMVIGHGKSDEFSKARQSLIYAVVGALFVNAAHALVRGVLATGF